MIRFLGFTDEDMMKLSRTMRNSPGYMQEMEGTVSRKKSIMAGGERQMRYDLNEIASYMVAREKAVTEELDAVEKLHNKLIIEQQAVHRAMRSLNIMVPARKK